MNKMKPTDFAIALSGYFFDYLKDQKGLSDNTIKSYTDTINMFLNYCEKEHNMRRDKMEISDLSRELVEGFLDWLETKKRNGVSTRNQRRAAMNTFLRYLQYKHPKHILLCQNILSIPQKKVGKQITKYLSLEAIEEILRQPDLSTRKGRRHHALISLLYETAARISEICDLRVKDVFLEKDGGVVHLHGKGNKHRDVPLTAGITHILKKYLDEECGRRFFSSDMPFFCNSKGEKLSRMGLTYVFQKYVSMARNSNSSLFPKKVHPHIFRHSKAMHWLKAGIDLEYIRDLLGHADLTTTEVYARLDIDMKRKMLEKVHPATGQDTPDPSWTDDKDLLSWLANFRTCAPQDSQ